MAPDRVAAEAAAIANQNKILFLVASAVATGDNATAFELQKAGIIANNVKIVGEIVALAGKLSEKKIGFVVMKGPIQQSIIYNDYYRRHSADIDVLVHGHEFDRTRAVLRGVGYSVLSPSKWWSTFLGEEHWRKRSHPSLMVDLHRHIHQPGTPGPSNEASLIDDTMIIDINGAAVPTLTKNHMQLLSVISFAKALYNREPSGAYICDLFASLMAAAPGSVNSFLSLAARRGMRGQSMLALRAMKEIFGTWPGLTDRKFAVLGSVSNADLRRMIFTPRAADLIWPKRRSLVWEYCNRNPLRFGYEVIRIGASELGRLTFERAAIARMTKQRP